MMFPREFPVEFPVPVTIKTTYTFQCSEVACGSEVSVDWYGSQIHTPWWPGDGWQLVEVHGPGSGRWICHKRKVTLTIDTPVAEQLQSSGESA